ncbi:hypothetical protein TYRP_012466 [Tyrophagus putrescentiae]|nr:hypothetical protein TYRP_012466 [Tyrophagus putrescentiae]
MKSAIVALLFLGLVAAAVGVAVVAPAYSYGYYGVPAYYGAYPAYSYGYRSYGYPAYSGYYGYPYLLKK